VNRRNFIAAAGSAAFALAVEPAALARRLGGTWLTLVTADLESHVAMFDSWRLTPAGRIRTAPGPRSIEAAHDLTAVVAHSQHGVVTLIDADTRSLYLGLDRNRVLAELDGLAVPRYTAVHPRRRIAYVTDSGDGAVVAIDLRRGRIVSRTSVRGPARHVSVSRDGSTLWTVLGSAAASIAVLDTSDPRRPRLVRTFAMPFPAHDVVFAPDGKRVWVTSGSERRIAIVGADGKVRRAIPAGAAPQHVAFAHDGALVTSGDDGTVRRHRFDGTLRREARVAVGSYNVSIRAGLGVTPSLASGAVTSLGAAGQTLARRDVGLAAHDACIVFGP
jgi:DNA-binding beta-propeller fold protein YncE